MFFLTIFYLIYKLFIYRWLQDFCI